jgi:hypothetical protein
MDNVDNDTYYKVLLESTHSNERLKEQADIDRFRSNYDS